jgi:hypothetical protein
MLKTIPTLSQNVQKYFNLKFKKIKNILTDASAGV